MKNYKRADIEVKNLKRIAILPLENLTPNKYADKKIRNLLIMDLLERDVNVIEPGEVTRVLRELKIRSVESISAGDMQSLGDMLKVDVILKGSVGTFEMKKGVAIEYPEVSIHLMLIDTKSGQILWSAWHTSGGASFWTRHFGAEGATLDETAGKVIKEVFDSLI
jgi:TolB-like protein